MSKRNENNAGLLITVIFHLTVIVVLLIYQVDVQKKREETFVIDFSKQEEIERMEKEKEELQKEIRMQEDILKKLEEKLANAPSNASQSIKNLAVNTSSGPLKDDRGTDAEQLYRDADRLARNLKNGHKSDIAEDASDETVDTGRGDDKPAQSYSGPSVLSYTLDGRQAVHLPIPAYRCYGGGQVTVVIYVNRNGNVVNAKVNETVSANDRCLRDYALRAARQSRFSKSSTAPERQTGEIVYQFIAQ